jgi:hypothetical protein
MQAVPHQQYTATAVPGLREGGVPHGAVGGVVLSVLGPPTFEPVSNGHDGATHMALRDVKHADLWILSPLNGTLLLGFDCIGALSAGNIRLMV